MGCNNNVTSVISYVQSSWVSDGLVCICMCQPSSQTKKKTKKKKTAGFENNEHIMGHEISYVGEMEQENR